MENVANRCESNMGGYLNQVICADSYEFIKQIPDKSIDLIYTDIPYLIEHRWL